MPDNFQGKKSTFISPFFVLLACAGMFFLFVKPKIEEIYIAKENIKQETEKLKRLTEKASFLKTLDDLKLSEDLKIITTALPSEKDVPSFMSTVNLLAQEASISVSSIQLSPGKISTDSSRMERGQKTEVLDELGGKLPIDLEIEGTFDTVKTFLVKMAKAMPIQTVKSISFTRKGDKQGVFGVLSSNFSLSIHYKLLPKFLGKISDPIDKLSPEEEALLSDLVNYTQPQLVQTFIPVGREDPFAKP